MRWLVLRYGRAAISGNLFDARYFLEISKHKAENENELGWFIVKL